MVDAPLERVWALHTDIDAWADWNTDVDQARLDGPLLPGNSFYWKTHGMDITSTIREVVPGQRLVWGGPAGGIDGVHVWTFEQTGSQVTVRTEESWSGAPRRRRTPAARPGPGTVPDHLVRPHEDPHRADRLTHTVSNRHHPPPVPHNYTHSSARPGPLPGR